MPMARIVGEDKGTVVKVPPPGKKNKSPGKKENALWRVLKRGFPIWVKVLVRGYIAIGLVFLFVFTEWTDPVTDLLPFDSIALGIFLTSCISIAMIFGIGYIIVTNGKRVKHKVKADIPSMVLIFVKACLTIGLLYLAYWLELLPEFAFRFLVALFGVVWIAFATGTYVYHVFRQTQ